MQMKKITTGSDELLMSEWLSEERHSLLRFIDESVIQREFNVDSTMRKYDPYLQDPEYRKHLEHSLTKELMHALEDFILESRMIEIIQRENHITGDLEINARLNLGWIKDVKRFKSEMKQAVKELTDDYEDL